MSGMGAEAEIRTWWCENTTGRIWTTEGRVDCRVRLVYRHPVAGVVSKQDWILVSLSELGELFTPTTDAPELRHPLRAVEGAGLAEA